MSGARIALIAIAGLLLAAASAHAEAGAPDPTFGTRGVVALPTRTSLASETRSATAIVLPDGGLLVPVFRTDYRVKRGEIVNVRARSFRLTWLDASGATVRSSAPIALPTDVIDPRVERTVDGHLLLVGARYGSTDVIRSLYVLRLSDAGAPEPAPGAASAAVTVPLASIPHLATTAKTRTSISDVVVAPSGRLFVLLTQSTIRSQEQPEVTGYGPLLAAAIDPSRGLATAFAGGSLVLVPSTDARSSAAVGMIVDGEDRLLVLTRANKRAIGGTSQDVRLVRYDAAGALDTTFAGGSVDIDAGLIDTAYSGVPSLAILRGGDVLARLDVAVERGETLSSGVELARFLPTGAPVAGFGTAGRATIFLDRSRSNGFGGSFSTGFDEGAPAALFEQPDGKLIVGAPSGSSFTRGSLGPGVVLRASPTGQLDTTYEQRGFARFDVPASGYLSATVSGLDPAGRAIATVRSYADAAGSRAWAVRLLAGDRPAPVATLRMRLDDRASCGTSLARACFDADGAAHVTGRVTVGTRPLAGAAIVATLTRPDSDVVSYETLSLPVVRTGPDGRFRLPAGKPRVMPGPWKVTARVLATPTSQRIDTSKPVHFTLGPRADIDTLRTVQRAQALATSLDYIVADTIDYDRRGNATKQCASVAACFRPSAEVLALVSATAHPAPGTAGLLLGKPDFYTVVARADTTAFRLEFVVTQTAFDTVYSCRGDAAARKRWCPGGTWSDSFNDSFVTAGIDGSPFDY